MTKEIVAGNRRFTVISPTLVRMEFAPDKKFENRRSMIAYSQKHPLAFHSVEKTKNAVILNTGKITVISKDNSRDFSAGSLEVQWQAGGFVQCWRPGDNDYQNLGGPATALDMMSQHARLEGVYPADGAHPDAKGLQWLSWHVCEEIPEYYKKSQKADLYMDACRHNGPHLTSKIRPETLPAQTMNRVLDNAHYPVGLLSKSGYFLLNDSETAVNDSDDYPIERNRPGTRDWYFFAYGNNFKTALQDFTLLSGKSPMPAKNAFGLWLSRWPAFKDDEAKEIVGRFDAAGIPLSVLVLDMEWHKSGWANWDWDEAMYAAPQAFMDWCHERDILVTLNTHPLRVEERDSHFTDYVKTAGVRSKIDDLEYGKELLAKVDTNVCDKREAVAINKVLNDDVMKSGVDFWWVDGARGQMRGLSALLAANKLHFENSLKKDRRGMLLSRYGGLGSHRYGIFFTGDAASEWEVLRGECEFSIRAGHVGMGYVSHDICGFAHPSSPLIDPIRYVRWLQFGVFNPVFRFHSAPGAGSRQPWDYGKRNEEIAVCWLKYRNSIIPYLYSMARKTYETGIPILRGLFFEHPEDKRCYRFDEYYFGDSMVVAPILDTSNVREVYLPEGDWFKQKTGERIQGGKVFTEIVNLADVPVYVRAGGLVLRQGEEVAPAAGFTEHLIIDAYPGAKGTTELYEDDGRSRKYERGNFGTTQFTITDNGKRIVLSSSAVKGKVFGRTRQITVNMALKSAAEKVRLNGKQFSGAVKYDTSTRRFSITLQDMPTSRPFQIEFIL